MLGLTWTIVEWWIVSALLGLWCVWCFLSKHQCDHQTYIKNNFLKVRVVQCGILCKIIVHKFIYIDLKNCIFVPLKKYNIFPAFYCAWHCKDNWSHYKCTVQPFKFIQWPPWQCKKPILYCKSRSTVPV